MPLSLFILLIWSLNFGPSSSTLSLKLSGDIIYASESLGFVYLSDLVFELRKYIFENVGIQVTLFESFARSNTIEFYVRITTPTNMFIILFLSILSSTASATES